MKKFCVFSGFLGSGKTTTMMALTQYLSQHYGKAAMISNDLGRQSLADHKLALLAGCNATELTGSCICYMTDTLAEQLDRLFHMDQCELVISDIPGFGVGALENVYHRLTERYPGQYPLAPFTVVTEPRSLDLLSQDPQGDIAQILNAQLLEADLILLNKADLLSPEDCQGAVAWLETAYPQAQVLSISAVTGQGMDTLAQALLQGTASMHHPAFLQHGCQHEAAIGRMSEYYLQYYTTVCCKDFDGNAYLLALAEAVQKSLQGPGWEIPHLKLLAWEPEGDYGKADLLGIHRPIVLTKPLCHPCSQLAVMVNCSALCPSGALDAAISQAVDEVSQAYQLNNLIFKKECFSVGG